jgi:hypothetical protein
MTDDDYAERAAKTFAVIGTAPGTLVMQGPCPRCGTLIDIPVVRGIYRGFTIPKAWPGSRRDTADTAGQDEPMMCTCEDHHPGRPEGQQGCGAYWILNIAPA